MEEREEANISSADARGRQLAHSNLWGTLERGPKGEASF